MRLFPVIFCVSFFQLALANYYYWQAPQLSSYEGLNQTFNVKSGNESGLYMATQFWFLDNNLGYFGLQPQESHGFMALFSYFGDNGTSFHPNCKSGADSGSGVSCHVYFDLTYDRNYTLAMSIASKNANNTITWKCHLTDNFGTNIDIGWWTIPQSYLQTQLTQFLEWFAKTKTNCMPKLDYEFWDPIFIQDSYTFDATFQYSTTATLQDPCTVNSGIVNATNEIYYTLPGGGYRSIIGQYTPDSQGYYYADAPIVVSSSITSISSTKTSATTSSTTIKSSLSTSSFFSSFKTLSTSTVKAQSLTTTPHATSTTATSAPSTSFSSSLEQLLNSLGLGDLGNLFNW